MGGTYKVQAPRLFRYLNQRLSLVVHTQVLMAVEGVQILSTVAPEAQAKILTDDAVKFLAALHRTFESTRQSLLKARESVQKQLDNGGKLDFPPETVEVRVESSWVCAPPAPGLEDRRVEITGPTDRKMVVNALNSGAKTFMADFEGIFLQPNVFLTRHHITFHVISRRYLSHFRKLGYRPSKLVRCCSSPGRL